MQTRPRATSSDPLEHHRHGSLPPRHSVARPQRPCRRRRTRRSVATIRAPEAPKGRPRAIAPPFTFTLAQTARIATAPSSVAGTLASPPPKRPIGVRAAEPLLPGRAPARRGPRCCPRWPGPGRSRGPSAQRRPRTRARSTCWREYAERAVPCASRPVGNPPEDLVGEHGDEGLRGSARPLILETDRPAR